MISSRSQKIIAIKEQLTTEVVEALPTDGNALKKIYTIINTLQTVKDHALFPLDQVRTVLSRILTEKKDTRTRLDDFENGLSYLARCSFEEKEQKTHEELCQLYLAQPFPSAHAASFIKLINSLPSNGNFLLLIRSIFTVFNLFKSEPAKACFLAKAIYALMSLDERAKRFSFGLAFFPEILCTETIINKLREKLDNIENISHVLQTYEMIISSTYENPWQLSSLTPFLNRDQIQALIEYTSSDQSEIYKQPVLSALLTTLSNRALFSAENVKKLFYINIGEFNEISPLDLKGVYQDFYRYLHDDSNAYFCDSEAYNQRIETSRHKALRSYRDNQLHAVKTTITGHTLKNITGVLSLIGFYSLSLPTDDKESKKDMSRTIGFLSS